MLDWMNSWMNDEKCMQMIEWMNVWKKDWKIRENRGFCLGWFFTQTGRELTHACVNGCVN